MMKFEIFTVNFGYKKFFLAKTYFAVHFGVLAGIGFFAHYESIFRQFPGADFFLWGVKCAQSRDFQIFEQKILIF